MTVQSPQGSAGRDRQVMGAGSASGQFEHAAHNRPGNGAARDREHGGVITGQPAQSLRQSGRRRIYVASSWRNPEQHNVVKLLCELGHEVYDFREPTPGSHGFSWHKIDPTIPRGPADLHLRAEEIASMLGHPAANDGFGLDMGALEWCDTCVLVLPCGRSAHLEVGWAAGAGRLTIGLLADGEPDLMWKMLDRLVVDLAGLAFAIGDAREAAA